MSQVTGCGSAWYNFKKEITEPFKLMNTIVYAKYAVMLAVVSLALGVMHCSNCFILHHDYQSIFSFTAVEKNFLIGYMSTGGGLCILALFLKVIAVWKAEVSEKESFRYMSEDVSDDRV